MIPIEILIIEDSPTQAEQLRFLLEENGYRVRVAGNGVEGLDLAREQRPDLVISDVVMPQMNGYEFCSAIRADAALCDVPVVLLTSFASLQNIIRGLECGAHNFLRKPYDPEYLVQRVRILIDGIQQRQRASIDLRLVLMPPADAEDREIDREQILDLLVSTYDQAIRMNSELSRQHDALAQWQYRLAAMHQIAIRTNEATSVTELLDRAAEELRQFPGVEAVVIGTIEPRRRVECGQPGTQVQRKGRPSSADERPPAVFPLQVGDRILGSLLMTMADPAAPDANDRTLLAAMADRIAAALDRLLLLASLEERVRERTAALVDEVAERRRSEQQLRVSEARYRLLFERNLAGIVQTNLEGQVLNCNSAFARMLGYEQPTDLEGIPIAGLTADLDARRSIFDQIKRYGQISNHEAIWRRRDGSPLTVLANITLTTFEENPVVEFTVVDITEHKRLEEQLRQSQKMESLGLFAGGIAHDFNNLLTLISGYADLLGEQIEGEEEPEKSVDGIRSAVSRAAALTRQLLAFSRNQVMRRQYIRLNDLIANDAEMFHRLLPGTIDLQLRYNSIPGSVHADRNQLEQVLLNLFVNARDAMPEGGRITVSTRTQAVRAGEIPPNSKAQPGSYAVLSVRDTGCGMTDEVRARIFEPFFSTKGERGTGLGLSTVHGIVVQSGGFIQVDTAPGKGTTFSIFLPLVAAESSPDAPAAAVSGPAPLTGPIHVLLVDDEEDIRVMMSDFLTWKGYTVVSSSDPHEAMELIRHRDAPLHLLITDVNLPGMDGIRMAREVRALYPDVRILFASGQTAQDLHAILAETPAVFLPKPFTAQQLHDCVRRLVKGELAAVQSADV